MLILLPFNEILITGVYSKPQKIMSAIFFETLFVQKSPRKLKL